MNYKFPKNFLWGSATASHQVEGNNNNNWSKWEKESADRLTKEELSKHLYLENAQTGEEDNFYSGLVSKDWYNKNFKELKAQMVDPKNFISANSVEHYERYREDLLLAKKLNHNSYRFSIEWSRIEPNEGEFIESELEHYKEKIIYMKSLGIEPIVTLWHWSIPIWLQDKGGVLSSDFSKYFLRYTEKVVNYLIKDVKYWITLNEPDIYTLNVYLRGEWLEQKKSKFLSFRSALNLIFTHNKAYKLIKSISKDCLVSFAKHDSYIEGTKGDLLSIINAKLSYFTGIWLWHFLTSKYCDYIGVNIYMRTRFKRFRINNDNERISDLGWELLPSAIYNVLMQLKKWNKPIIITENGLADRKDAYRSWYIKEVVKYMYKAIKDGVDLRGYMHWSLLDNFEWSHGFWPEFGLIHVDRKTQKRTIRKSAFDYAMIIKDNGFKDE